jgi:RNA recognition motif. (a.k.a. RRM, RBD, or RNP domain)
MTSRDPVLKVRVFVGGLGAVATELELRDAFVDVGVRLSRIEVVMSTATGCSRGFAFALASRMAPDEHLGDEDDILGRMRVAFVRGRPLTVHPVPTGLRARVSH